MFKRPPSSILAKMANLDGSRKHGARHDAELAEVLLSDLALLGDLYRSILLSARASGIGSSTLPDFLRIEKGGQPQCERSS